MLVTLNGNYRARTLISRGNSSEPSFKGDEELRQKQLYLKYQDLFDFLIENNALNNFGKIREITTTLREIKLLESQISKITGQICEIDIKINKLFEKYPVIDDLLISKRVCMDHAEENGRWHNVHSSSGDFDEAPNPELVKEYLEKTDIITTKLEAEKVKIIDPEIIPFQIEKAKLLESLAEHQRKLDATKAKL